MTSSELPRRKPGTARNESRRSSLFATAAAYVIAVLPVLVLGTAQSNVATALDGAIVLADFTAPNIVGDSNVSASAEGPDAFMISSEYCNTNTHSVYDVSTNVGTWDALAVNRMPGEFPDTVVPPGGSYSGTFDLDMDPGTGNPETRYRAELTAGECLIISSIVTYDVVDANNNPVWGASNSNADDLVYDFDFWVGWTDPGPNNVPGGGDDVPLEANASDTVTVRNEITAASNKIETSVVTVTPATTIAVGETVSITFDGVTFGSVNQGFDADGDGNPDYDIWFQAIGEADLWDPDVFQLVGIEASITGSQCGGGRPNTTLTASDTTYFKGLDAYGNCNWKGTYTYEFIALAPGTSTVAPYQEAASGSDNEKYNGDYCGDDPTSSPEYCLLLTATDATVTLDKSVTPQSANPGDTLTWSIAYTNSGTTAVGDPLSGFGVYVHDTVPAGTTYTAGTAVCGALTCAVLYSTDGGATFSVAEPLLAATVTDIRWAIEEPVLPGVTDTVSFSTTIDVGTTGFVDNEAFVTLGGQLPPLDSAEAFACAGGCSELAIDKDTTTPAVVSGQQATYTIKVENLATATADADDVVVADSLPSGFTYAATTSIVPANTDGTDPVRTATTNPTVGDSAVTWGTWDLQSGDSITITFVVDVAGTVAPGTYDNSATATQNGAPAVDDGLVADDGGFVTGTDPEMDEDVTISAVSPGLVIDKDTSTPIAIAGSQASYTIVVDNIGTADALGVTIDDTFPAGWTYASSSVAESGAVRTSNVNPAVGASTANWGTWTISPGGSVTITLLVDIPATAGDGVYDNTAGADATNHAAIDDDGLTAQDADTPSGSDPENDEDVTLQSADLSITKVDLVDPVPAGTDITYEIVVTNDGPLNATGVTAVDTLPGSSTFGSATSTQGSCTQSGGTVTCAIGAMLVGDSVTITVVLQDPGPLLTNTVVVGSSSYDGNSSNDTASEDTSVLYEQIAKSSDIPDMVAPGGTINYTIDITNTSGVNWTGIAISDPLPSGTTYNAGTSMVSFVDDNVVTSYTDDFESNSFAGSGPGSLTWNGSWIDSEGDGAATGDVLIATDPNPNLVLEIGRTGRSVYRSANTTDATDVTISFDYRWLNLDAGDSVTAAYSTNGGATYTTLTTLGAPGTLGAYQTFTTSIGAVESADFRLRFFADQIGGGGPGNKDDNFYVDNVSIQMTKTETIVAAAGAPADLLDGTEGYVLAPNGSMTLTYAVTVNNPSTVAAVLNTATLTTDQVGPVSASVSDPVSSSIGDFVWEDLNGNGIADDGATGIDGVDLDLYLDDGDGVFEPGTDDVLVTSMTTAGGGAYDFTGLGVGSYWVSVDDTTLPAADTLTTGNDPLLVAITTGGTDFNTADFGYWNPGFVSETVFFDADGDGVFDPGEQLVGVPVEFSDGTTTYTVVTDANGVAVSGPFPGGAVATIDIDDSALPANSVLSVGTDPTDITVVAGTTTNDTTGYEAAGFVSETVFFDSNSNGVLDPGEELVGVDVTFTDGTTTYTVATGVNGVATSGPYLGDAVVTIDVDDTDLPAASVITVGTDPTDITVVTGTTVNDTTGYEKGIDYGDAPASYGSAAALTSDQLRLGAGVTRDSADRNDDTDADDGVDFNNATVTASGYALPVAVTNSTGGSVWVCGWIDLDKSGTFEVGERQCDEVLVGETEATLTWTGVGDLSGTSFTRFRVSSSQAEAELATGETSAGEVEDYPIDLATLPVTVAYFSSVKVAGGIDVTWWSGTEAGNAGYLLYAKAKGELVAVTDFIVGAGDSFTPLEYQQTVTGRHATLWLADVDLNGYETLHGPYQVGKTVGSIPAPVELDWDAARSEADAALAADEAQQVADQNRSTVQSAAVSAVGSILATTMNGAMASLGSTTVFTVPDVAGAGNVAVMPVDVAGVYRISSNDLLGAGLDWRSVRMDSLAVVDGAGEPVAIRVSRGKNFTDNRWVEFVGAPLDTLYTGTNVYRLVVDPSKRVLMNVDSSRVRMRDAAAAVASHTLVVEDQNVYSAAAPGDDPWYSLDIYSWSPQHDTLIELDHLAAGDGAIEVTVWGGIDFAPEIDHQVSVAVNGVELGNVEFGGVTEAVITATVPDGVLVEGTNTVTVTIGLAPGMPFDWVSLDRIEVTAPRKIVAVDGVAAFAADADRIEVSGLTSLDVEILRLGADGDLARLRRRKSTEHADGTFTVSFAGTGGDASYVVTQVDSIKTPEAAAARTPTALLDGAADLLIISHTAFSGNLGDLVAAREAQGLAVKVVEVEDLYAAYTGEVFDPSAISAYITDAAAVFGDPAVLLVGADSRDYRNDGGTDSIAFIPTTYGNVGVGTVSWSPLDPAFVDLDGDRVPDLDLGRFPVRTLEELAHAIDKAIVYTPDSNAVIASESGFKDTANNIAASMPADTTVTTAHLDDLTVADARSTLIGGINDGAGLAVFFGHSSTDQWTAEGLLTTSDASEFTNIDDPTVVVQFGCWNTYFSDPTQQSLGSALLTEQGGGAAVLGATTLTSSGNDAKFGPYLMDALSTSATVGGALTVAKQNLASVTSAPDITLGWTLLGDPTTPLLR